MYPSIPSTSDPYRLRSVQFHRPVYSLLRMHFPDIRPSAPAIQSQSQDRSMPFHLHHLDDKNRLLCSKILLHRSAQENRVQILPESETVPYSQQKE